MLGAISPGLAKKENENAGATRLTVRSPLLPTEARVNFNLEFVGRY